MDPTEVPAPAQRTLTRHAAEQPAILRQLGLKLRFAQAAVWSDLLMTFKPFGLRPQHYAALSLIAGMIDCKQQDIGAALGISSSNLVGLIDEFVAAELVIRTEKQGDRRSNKLSLTAKGRALLDRMSAAQLEHERRLAQCLTVSESTTLLMLLDKLTKLHTPR